MDSDSGDEKPIPKKRTVVAEHRFRSSRESLQATPPSRSPEVQRPPKSLQRQRHSLGHSKEDEAPEGISDKPKPKPRTVPPPESTPAASSAIPEVPSTSSANPSSRPSTSLANQSKPSTRGNADGSEKTKSKKRFGRSRRSQKEEAASIPDRLEEEAITSIAGTGDAGTGLRIRDILQAFQDDVVTVQSSQRGKWQEKMDAIQSQLMFPELDQRKFETATGWDRSASVPSKWKSAASLIPRDSVDDESQTRNHASSSIFRIYSNGLNHFSFYSSGILCGLLLWRALFAVSQMMASTTFDLSPFFWILFWTVTTLLLLTTILGFLNRRVEDSSLSSSLLRFIPCLLVFVSYYLSKAFDLQRSECAKLLEVKRSHLRNIHETYRCVPSVAGKEWDDFNYWKITLDVLPALGTLLIYTFLHVSDHYQRFSGSAASLTTNL